MGPGLTRFIGAQGLGRPVQDFPQLSVHPDVDEAVREVRELGIPLVTLSNGSATVADTLLQGAGVRDRFERLRTAEDAGVWKPAERSYAA